MEGRASLSAPGIETGRPAHISSWAANGSTNRASQTERDTQKREQTTNTPTTGNSSTAQRHNSPEHVRLWCVYGTCLQYLTASRFSIVAVDPAIEDCDLK